jgi:O-methyltransferase involved in polyketide biosynthesis
LSSLAKLAPGSTVAMTFLLRPELLDDAERSALKTSQQGARQAGTPFLSFYAPEEMLEMARAAGFAGARQVSGAAVAERYFSGRSDGLRPSSGEDFLLATT